MPSLPRWFATALLLALAATALPAAARSLHGVVTHVTDGDTLWVRPPGGGAPLAVRLQGIDAPEICQAFGARAREALAGQVLQRRVHVLTRARDRYRRTVGRVDLGGQDIAAWLVSGGYAWSARYQHRAGPYAVQEAQARAHRRGLWAAPAPLAPRTFRQRHGSCH
jgi:micrococcal nuclease